ncbi:hypothetical protein [Streptomyces viridosporus]|uniref:hypothetical protein n=1 Tax=Streptomyces viridosporus TaxID=67581 RepID=UPI0036FAC299
MSPMYFRPGSAAVKSRWNRSGTSVAGEDVVDAGGVGDPRCGGRRYEAEHGLDVVPAGFEGQVPDPLVVSDAVAELVQPLARVFYRGQGTVGA